MNDQVELEAGKVIPAQVVIAGERPRSELLHQRGDKRGDGVLEVRRALDLAVAGAGDEVVDVEVIVVRMRLDCVSNPGERDGVDLAGGEQVRPEVDQEDIVDARSRSALPPIRQADSQLSQLQNGSG